MPAHATLAGGALDVYVLVHALDVIDSGVDAGGDGLDLQRDGVQTAVQRGESLARPVLIVPGGEDAWRVRTSVFMQPQASQLLPGVVLQVVHVLLVFVHESCCIVQLHLQVHHLDKTKTRVLPGTLIEGPQSSQKVHPGTCCVRSSYISLDKEILRCSTARLFWTERTC